MTNAEKIDAAISAHSEWFIKLRVAINEGTSQFKPETVRTDNQCEFGKWLYGKFPAELKESESFSQIKKLHAEFHREAGSILALALAGKRQEALAGMDANSNIRKCSTALVRSLNSLKSSC